MTTNTWFHFPFLHLVSLLSLFCCVLAEYMKCVLGCSYYSFPSFVCGSESCMICTKVSYPPDMNSFSATIYCAGLEINVVAFPTNTILVFSNIISGCLHSWGYIYNYMDWNITNIEASLQAIHVELLSNGFYIEQLYNHHLIHVILWKTWVPFKD